MNHTTLPSPPLLRPAPFRVWLLCVSLLCAASLANAADLTQAEFVTLHKQLQPSPDEPWRTIPWKISLLDAQAAAAEQQKPIFIWAMDGHPLGCT